MTELVEHRVYGPPGTGKTTYLADLCKRTATKFSGMDVVVASLTRAGATEIGGRDTGIPEQHVGTLHAHAFRALGRPRLAETREGLKMWNEAASPRDRITNRSIVDPENAPAEGMYAEGDGEKMLQQMMVLRQRMVREDFWPPSVRRFASQWEAFKAERHRVDFTDLIEDAIKMNEYHPSRPRFIMLDEAQDMSKLEMTLARQWGAQCEQLVVVGDPDQNLYQWRGSDPEAFVAREPASVRILEQSYRVPRAVHEVAVDWIRTIPTRPDVAYRPREVDGLVRSESQWLYREPGGLVSDIQKQVALGRSCMVLASCGYMLQPLVAELKGRRVPFGNPYRTNHGGWNPLQGGKRVLAFLRPRGEVWGDEAAFWSWGDVKQWMSVMQSRGYLSHGAKTFVEGKCHGERFGEKNADIMAELRTVIELMAGEENLDGAISMDLDWWEKSLKLDDARRLKYPIALQREHGGTVLRDTPKVCVGTIHSVKGGEADVVYLYPDLSHVAYYEGWEKPKYGGRDAIIRQFYVGMTRAREELVLCGTSGSEYVRWP